MNIDQRLADILKLSPAQLAWRQLRSFREERALIKKALITSMAKATCLRGDVSGVGAIIDHKLNEHALAENNRIMAVLEGMICDGSR